MSAKIRFNKSVKKLKNNGDCKRSLTESLKN